LISAPGSTQITESPVGRTKNLKDRQPTIFPRIKHPGILRTAEKRLDDIGAT
jgi:hypothetical protein